MKTNSLYRHSTRPARRAIWFAAITAAIAVTASAAGCGGDTVKDRDSEGGSDEGSAGGSDSTTQFFERLTQSSVDKIDLLLAIDNSRSMADKQQLLALAVPDLVTGLVNPRCVDESGAASAMQPAGPLEKCPVAGTKREFEPVTDIHVGVISSSIGGHGSDACPNQENNTCPAGSNFSNNDKGHLLSRTDPCGGGDVPTYQSKGFLAWDPKQGLAPPGEASIDGLVMNLKDMVTGVGEIGCGYEATLESWYRFLVDPEPYESISVIDNKATPAGLDSVLLKQRADFLRPSSLLAIIMLSDENDCSIKEYGQFFFAAQLKNGNGMPFHLPRARAECAKNPNDPCCKSCGQSPGNCPADPSCVDGNGNPKALTMEEDPASLRCFDQKRRFGIDFLHSIDRYTQALTSPVVPNRGGALVPNPLFSDLNPSDDLSIVRDSGLVLLAAIVGVPWQDIARDEGDLTKGFKTSDELLVKDTNGLSTWDIVLGDPDQLVPPKDPHMIEQIDPRTGTNPITGDAIKPPNTPNPPDPSANPINGHEYTPTPMARDDLQYACIFPLPEPRDCTAAGAVSCDCKDPMNDSPLCDDDPAKPGSKTYQARAKAYPGLRELALMRAIGPQGVTASICPAQVSDWAASDFGYRPAVGSIVDRLKGALGSACLPRALTPDSKGNVSCVVLEARKVEDGNAAACNQCKDLGRQTAYPAAVQAAKNNPSAPSAGWNCFCEITQVTGDDLQACQNDIINPPINPTTSQAVNGWCYVDATVTPPVGNPDIVAKCLGDNHRQLRFVGEGAVHKDATVFLACSQP